MKINKNNYEAYLLDLSEGNLSDELRDELNSFLALHPDLEADIIEDFQPLTPNTDSSIDQNLLQFDSITELNRKHFFIAYHEGDLSSSEQSEVLTFISKNTSYENEFNKFSKIYLSASNEIFEDKTSLHSIANTDNSKGIIYWSVRVAAILIIGFILNNYYQSTSAVLPRYTLVKDELNLKPSLERDSEFNFAEFIPNKVQNNSSISNARGDSYKSESPTEIIKSNRPDSIKTTTNRKNKINYSLEKRKLKVINENPALDKIIASLNPNKNKLEVDKVETSPIKNIETPPSLLAFLGEKAKNKNILTESGRPNFVSLLNKGSKSLSGQDLLAKSETEKSNSTIFKLGSLKIERITQK